MGSYIVSIQENCYSERQSKKNSLINKQCFGLNKVSEHERTKIEGEHYLRDLPSAESAKISSPPHLGTQLFHNNEIGNSCHPSSFNSFRISRTRPSDEGAVSKKD